MNNNSELFSSWPIPRAMKLLLSWEEKWIGAFSIDPAGMTLLLRTLSDELKQVNYFSSLPDTQQFFEFLKKLIESKPQDSQVLNQINNIHSDIFEKITFKKSFNASEAKVGIEYLSFLQFLLKTEHHYLFTNPEITLRADHLLTLSKIRYQSTDFLTQFRHTLLASFECKTFLDDHLVLVNVISNLTKSLKKKWAENNERAAMQMFDMLGSLAGRLQTSQDLNLNISNLESVMLKKSRYIYRRFKPFVEPTLLSYSNYKLFLTQAYRSAKNFTQLCQSDAYRRQCVLEYSRFVDNYRCTVDQFPDFLIEIKNNNHTQTDLNKVCSTMRSVETFVPWMEETFDFRAHYNRSQYTLHLSVSEKDFLIDKFLFEQDDPLKESYSVQATYFQAKKNSQTDSLLGSAYTYSMGSSSLIHEYIHHLTALFINNLELDLTLTEGLAELNSAGVCSERHIRDLRRFVNDTFIFEFFKARKFPFYFNALKWVAYLINEQPELFKSLMEFLQKNDTQGFYAKLDAFSHNEFNQQQFVTWAHQQVNICNTYLISFPNGHQPPILYLKEISAKLNQAQNLGLPEVSLSKRDLSSQAAELERNETLGKTYSNSETQAINQDIQQGLEAGIPLNLAALFAGMTSSILDDVGLTYKANYPSLPMYINNGFKPFVFAAMSAGLNTIFFDQAVAEVDEKFSRLFVYFVMNFVAVVIAQPLNKKLAERVQNKLLNFFIQMMTWTLLWNPSLFLSEGSRLFSTLFLQVTQALCFKVGEETYQLGKRICSPFWERNKSPAFDIAAAFSESDNDEESFKNKVSLRHS